MTSKKSKPDENFLALLMANQKRIFGFIQSLIPSDSDADDLFQETVMYMWRNFDKYRSGSNFSAWGIQVARYRIMKFRENNKKSCLHFNDELFNRILEYTEKQSPDMVTEQLKILDGCIDKLKETDKQIIRMRYSRDMTTQSLANTFGRTIQGLYKTIARIHLVLVECVKRSIAAGDTR